MKTILVPTDGSSTAEAALGVALDLAEKHGAKIMLLHVLLRDKEPSELLRLPGLKEARKDVAEALGELAAGPATPRTASDILSHPGRPERPVPEALLRTIGAHVLKRASAQARARRLSVEELDLADGPAAPMIVALARMGGIDAIVMGTRGLRQIEAIAFGSVSQEVCRSADCACIAVHPPRRA
jgi:nucleotide-binding universal stress UspA family protein